MFVHHLCDVYERVHWEYIPWNKLDHLFSTPNWIMLRQERNEFKILQINNKTTVCLSTFNMSIIMQFLFFNKYNLNSNITNKWIKCNNWLSHLRCCPFNRNAAYCTAIWLNAILSESTNSVAFFTGSNADWLKTEWKVRFSCKICQSL